MTTISRAKTALVSGALVFALLGAACSDGDDETTATGASDATSESDATETEGGAASESETEASEMESESETETETSGTESESETETETSGTESESETESAAAEEQGVEIVDFEFQPAMLTVAPGTTVTWTNADDTEHTATSTDGAPAQFDTDVLAEGETGEFTFEEPGTYEYICSIHEYMNGTVEVEG